MELLRARGWERYARFVESADLHLTLRFLGEISEETMDVLRENALELAARTEPVSYEIGRPALFPRVSRARVIAARVTPSGELRALVRELEALSQRAGLEAETRLFRPHITLARLRRGTIRPHLPSRPGTVPQQASSLSLLRTHLGDSSAAYEEVSRFPLKEPDVDPDENTVL